MPVPGGTVPADALKPALAQLLAVLRAPRSREQEDQILHILKTHPQLMSAFIKQRQIVQQQLMQQSQQFPAER